MQIQTSTGLSTQIHLRNYNEGQLEIMPHCTETGLRKLFRNTSTFVEQGNKSWSNFIFLLKTLFLNIFKFSFFIKRHHFLQEHIVKFSLWFHKYLGPNSNMM